MILAALAIGAALTAAPACLDLTGEPREIRLLSAVDASEAAVRSYPTGVTVLGALDDGREYSVSEELMCTGGPAPTIRFVQLPGAAGHAEALGYADADLFTPVPTNFDRWVVGGPGGAIVRDRASTDGRELTRLTETSVIRASEPVASGAWLALSLNSGQSGYVRAIDVATAPASALLVTPGLGADAQTVEPNTGYFIAFILLNAIGALSFHRRATDSLAARLPRTSGA